MKLGLLAILALAMTACSGGELSQVTSRDVQVLRSVVAHGCERDDGQYVVLSSKPASDVGWSIPEAWEESAKIRVQLERRASSNLSWPAIDLCAGVRFADSATIEAALEKSSRIPPGWDAFYKQFPGAGGLIMVSLPAFSSKGDTAVVILGSLCGPLCGNGFYLQLERTGDSWKISHIEQAWIS
jgi:hypothetical protein